MLIMPFDPYENSIELMGVAETATLRRLVPVTPDSSTTSSPTWPSGDKVYAPATAIIFSSVTMIFFSSSISSRR